jgi:uncharacterized membrane protein YkoI
VNDHNYISRRLLLQLLLGAGLVVSSAGHAFADGGGDGEHHENGGSEHHDGGGSTGGGDDSASDDSNSPDSASSDDSADSSSSVGTGSGGAAQSVGVGGRRFLNQDEVKKVVASGNAASLPLLLAYVGQNYPGDVLDVKMRKVDGGYAYDVKVLSNLVVLRTVSLEAKTLKKL